MKELESICAYYSRGPHFGPMLRRLRSDHPHAQITAMVPPGYPADAAKGADQVQETPHADYSIRHPAAIMDLAREIRKGRYDVFAVMFDSAKLRLLARASGAAQRNCHLLDGRVIPLRGSLVALFFRKLWRRCKGEITYRYIHYVVHHRPTEVEKARENKGR